MYEKVHLLKTQDVEEENWGDISGLATLLIVCEVIKYFFQKEKRLLIYYTTYYNNEKNIFILLYIRINMRMNSL